MCIDELRFEAAKNRVIGINRERQGIGTLSEKTVHAVLKLLCAGYGYARNPNRKFCGGHFYGDRDH